MYGLTKEWTYQKRSAAGEVLYERDIRLSIGYAGPDAWEIEDISFDGGRPLRRIFLRDDSAIYRQIVADLNADEAFCASVADDIRDEFEWAA